MNFFTMQSLGTYTRNMQMQMKWQQKKANNDFTADGNMKLTDPIARQAEEIRLSQADGSSKISSQIRAKLAAGKKLTREEMEYLQKNDPQTYQKAKAIEEEQKGYEEDLKRCRTKEDVQRVRMNRTAASLSVVNSVESNSAIPEGAKLGIIWQELQKNMAMEEAIGEFVKSGRYAKLPTEAELRAAEKALEEARHPEPEIKDSPDNTEETDIHPDEAEKDGSQISLQAWPSGSSLGGNEEEIADAKPEAKSDNASILASVQRNQAVLQELKSAFAKTETTPETSKVKWDKVHAAYKELSRL